MAKKFQWVVQSYTGSQYGWEIVYHAENKADAMARLKEYRENEPVTSHRVRFVQMEDEE